MKRYLNNMTIELHCSVRLYARRFIKSKVKSQNEKAKFKPDHFSSGRAVKSKRVIFFTF